MELSWRVKWRQAQAHIALFATESQAYLDASRAGFKYVFDDDAGSIDVVLSADFEPEAKLGAIVGDVLHNLRSALDAIAWETCARTGVPLTEGQEKNVYFPVTCDPDEWTSAAGRLVGVPADQREAFRQLQPWYWDEQARQRGIEVPKEFAKREPLWQLTELAKQDRHRTVHPLLARAGDTWLGTPEGVETRLAAVSSGPWTPGTTILRWTVWPAKRVREATPAGSAVLTLGDREEEALSPTPALRTLTAFSVAVDQALRYVEVAIGVVSPDQLEELRALGEQANDARRAVQLVMRETAGMDLGRFRRLEALRQACFEAEAASNERWKAVFRH